MYLANCQLQWNSHLEENEEDASNEAHTNTRHSSEDQKASAQRHVEPHAGQYIKQTTLSLTTPLKTWLIIIN